MNKACGAMPDGLGLRKHRRELQPGHARLPFFRKAGEIQILLTAAAPVKADAARVSARDQILDDGFDRCESRAGREANHRLFGPGAQIELAIGESRPAGVCRPFAAAPTRLRKTGTPGMRLICSCTPSLSRGALAIREISGVAVRHRNAQILRPALNRALMPVAGKRAASA